jgi:hypothetical protein
MVSPELVLFAIQAAVKLGRKLYDVLVTDTVEAPLLLPFGSFAGSIQEAQAVEFFGRKENRALLMSGGPYASFANDRTALVKACHTIQCLDSALGVGRLDTGAGVEVILNLHQFEQHKESFGPQSPWQRILGTVVEIGIDYFVANPQAIGKDSAARRVVESFLVGIDGIDFAKGEPIDIVGTALTAALQALGDNSALITHDRRIAVLLGGVTNALRHDLKVISLGELQRREELFERITSSILRAGAGAVADNPDLFIQGDRWAKEAVRGTLVAILDGIRDHEHLFSNAALEQLFKTSLSAVSQRAKLFASDKVLQAIIKNTVGELTKVDARELFSGASVEAITRAALQTVSENSETLIDPTNPQRQWIAHAVAAMAQGLASDLAGTGSVKELFSMAQLLRTTHIIFDAVAKHPEQLLGGDGNDPRRTALAQILASVATALGNDPIKLVNGETLVGLVETALGVTLKNIDKLLDLHSSDPRTNALYKILAAVADAAQSGLDLRHLLDRDVFLETVRHILPVASANIEPLLGGDAQLVEDVVLAALRLASGPLANRINGANLPRLVEGLLRDVLLRELPLNDADALVTAADGLLRLAA